MLTMKDIAVHAQWAGQEVTAIRAPIQSQTETQQLVRKQVVAAAHFPVNRLYRQNTARRTQAVSLYLPALPPLCMNLR